MAQYLYHYSNLSERREKVAQAEALGYLMLHDDFDPDWQPGSEPHGTLTFTDTMPEPAPEQVYQRQLAEEFNNAHQLAIAAYKNWGNVTPAQKDAILKNLMKWALWKDGWLKLGVL